MIKAKAQEFFTQNNMAAVLVEDAKHGCFIEFDNSDDAIAYAHEKAEESDQVVYLAAMIVKQKKRGPKAQGVWEAA